MKTLLSESSAGRKSRPSLRDLAKQLDVSHTTVNMGLKGDPRISASLRAKIRKVAEREGYFPNDLATVLRTGRTRLIGCVVPVVNSGYISVFMESAIQELWDSGYFPITLCSKLDRNTEAQMLESLARLRVEGVLIMPSHEDSGEHHFAGLLKDHIPIVTINNPIPKLDLPMVASDDIHGAQIATQHLIALGHQRIVHIGAPPDSRHADIRRETGFRRTMKEAGLKPHVLYYEDRLHVRLPATALKKELLEKPPGQRATAVFCYNDHLALRLYDFCRKNRIKIPEDLSVIGYSNEGWQQDSPHILDFVAPPLSTVEQNSRQIGTLAAKNLRALIDNQKPDPPKVLIEPILVERASTRGIKPA